MRIGIGRDIHKLVYERKLILGGVFIDYEKGLLGHSDADVLIHSIMDSLLGAIGEKNIGYHFPDTDDKYKNISSLELLKIVYEKFIKYNCFIISNIDCVIIAERPKINPFIDKMKKNISNILKIEESQIGIKATTNEGLGDIGQGNAIEAVCISLIQKIK
jgi:2-C-methyl-D-erythritol 2,4-cyclodiphosphate synthase